MHRQSIIIDNQAFAAGMGTFQLRLAQNSEIKPTLKLGENLLASKLAQPDIVAAVHAHTKATVWVIGETDISGFLLTLPLTDCGERAVRDGSFTPSNPDFDHLCRPGDPCFGIYVWVYGGATRDARRNVMQASAILRMQLFAPVPMFARGATDDGVRSMQSLGMSPVTGGLPDLWVWEAIAPQQAAA